MVEMSQEEENAPKKCRRHERCQAETKLQDNSGQREIISENLVKGHSNPAYKQVDKEANVPLSHKITLTKKIHSIAPQQSTFGSNVILHFLGPRGPVREAILFQIKDFL